MDLKTTKEKLNGLGVTFKNRKVESVDFFKDMGDSEFQEKLKSIISDFDDPEILKSFHNSVLGNVSYLNLYDKLYKKFNF